ncbi:hypothetical protein [uncultured Maribacter sp.]|uniref:hypothetical protein n=1 Tax=uncultured Maribacter sp. TaxID=431308 RepID=UPI0030DAD909|tara:strand:+ start:205 stop:636 length:432 start_codon:yes stop_codon:yes gene_type:complete
MEKEQISTSQKNNCVEELHWKTQQWKSHFQIMDDELILAERLLDSQIFRPKTRNLFERIQEYKKRIKKIKDTKKGLLIDISIHENNLGGMLEYTDNEFELSFYRNHDKLQNEVDSCFKTFQKLKLEIFNYTGGFLDIYNLKGI